MEGRVLVVDDDRDMCELIEADLSQRGLSVRWHVEAEEAFQAFMAEPVDIVLTDLMMPRLNGIDFCHRLSVNRPEVPVVVITAFGSLDTAIAAIRAGAFDFVTKPVEMDLLAIVVERALKHRALQEKVRFLQEAAGGGQDLDEFIGSSPPMGRLRNEIERVADSTASVLLTGESGTGKELVACALHRRSSRRNQRFVAVNCAALPDSLLESELFGHARGAFTGASSARTGLFLEANGGTLFLDEIGEIPLALQPKLLRALEQGTVRPVGGDREVPCDVRLVAATNRDLETAVAERRFREDLFFRINVLRISLPPLRARGGDALLLAQHFVREFAKRYGKAVEGLSPAVADKLLAYRWPGNVRELRNAVERAVALTRFSELAVEDLPDRIRSYRSTELRIDAADPAELVPLEEMEKRYILHVLEAAEGNKALAARILGLDRTTLYRRLERYGEPAGLGPDGGAGGPET